MLYCAPYFISPLLKKNSFIRFANPAPPMIDPWIEPEPEQLPVFGKLLIYGALCLLVFRLTCLHSVCLLLAEPRRWTGWWEWGIGVGWVAGRVGGLKSSAWCEGGSRCLLCRLPSHFMAPSVHRQTVKWWRVSSSLLLDSVNFLLIYMHICCWECVPVYIANLIFGHTTESFLIIQ